MAFDLVPARLHNQLLSQSGYTQPDEVVAWFGAVQSQEYAGAKWALSLRMKDGATDSALDQAFNEGRILRTHVMRPTWHFVTPGDICWMLELTAPRVRAAMSHMDRQLEVDTAVVKKSNAILSKALRGKQQLTRAALTMILNKAGLSGDGQRIGHLLMHAELDGVICSGGRQGKKFSYALLEERAPAAGKLQREEALAELARRYFRSHAPATLQDFVWWSGLTTTDARKGIEATDSEFEQETVNDRTYWFLPSTFVKRSSSKAYLLPYYDEYTVAYKDRSAIFDASHSHKLSAFRESILTQTIMIDGQISGTWKRTVKKSGVTIELAPFFEFTKAQHEAVVSAVHRYEGFLELPIELIT